MSRSKTGNRPTGRRLSVGRRGTVVAVSAVAVLCAGVALGTGDADAKGTSARSQALGRAAAQASAMPSAKARLFTQGVDKAFPSQVADKPGQQTPAPAPGAAQPSVADNRVPGISSLRQAPFAPVDFAVQNSYSAKIKGRWYVAYAGTIGGEGADRGLGGIRILTADPGANTDLRDLGTFAASGTTGLKVTSHSGTTITLVSDTGDRLTFDLATLTFG